MESQMAEKCLIEQTKRTRVGGTGPRRNKLKTFALLGKVAPCVVDELNYVLDTHTRNDIGGDNYGISQNCNYEEVFNVGNSYRQVLMQTKKPENESQVDEYAYTEWDRTHPMRWTYPALNGIFHNTYRFRLSEMTGGHELNWHIDADTSVICRAQICLNENDSRFEFKDKEGIKSLDMKPGDVYFINTGWNHRVVSGDITRRTAIIGFHFDDLKNNGVLYL
jgi:hypothetical protein